MSGPVPDLLPCPFCGTDEHLAVVASGSLTADMPARPRRVVCRHIDHDQVAGPVAYGYMEAITAWNTRSPDLLAMVEKLAGAVALAANRLHRLSVEAIVSGDERLRCNVLDWVDEARASFHEAKPFLEGEA